MTRVGLPVATATQSATIARASGTSLATADRDVAADLDQMSADAVEETRAPTLLEIADATIGTIVVDRLIDAGAALQVAIVVIATTGATTEAAVATVVVAMDAMAATRAAEASGVMVDVVTIAEGRTRLPARQSNVAGRLLEVQQRVATTTIWIDVAQLLAIRVSGQAALKQRDQREVCLCQTNIMTNYSTDKHDN